MQTEALTWLRILPPSTRMGPSVKFVDIIIVNTASQNRQLNVLGYLILAKIG